MDKENKKFIIETIFLREAVKYNLSLSEFIVLMYFDNKGELFDVKKIVDSTGLSEEGVLSAFESLLEKKLIVLNSVKNEIGKIVDKVSLDNLYKKIKDEVKKKKNDNKEDDFFTEFQKYYGRSLSGLDYECIKGWLSAGFSEEMIIYAVREASYNGAYSLSYIDSVLYAWKKKDINTPKDVEEYLKSRDFKEVLIDENILEYNWLDEE